MAKRIGRHTLLLTCSPSVIGYAAVGARKEKQGPLADYFDLLSEDSSFGEKTWEQAETLMQKKAVELALQKSSLKKGDIDFLFAGDLLNQCISSAYASREMQIPFFGLYGACSTMSESLSLASLFVEAGLARHCVAATSSHFCSAERQFRFPLEYGGQRTPTSQWTVTGSGACVVAAKRQAPYVRAVTVGTVADLGITDINNMGAAMAPAAAQTLCQYFADTNTRPQDYDMILTGDLGFVGSRLLERLMQQFDLTPADILVVDDLKPGFDMARAAGCDFIAALWGYPNGALRQMIAEGAQGGRMLETPAELYQALFGEEMKER